MEESEEALISELYRRFTGPELEKRVTEAKRTLLQQMIDQKILYLRAARMFDLESMEDAFLSHVMEQQNIESEEELVKVLTQEGMTLEQFKKRIMESFISIIIIIWNKTIRNAPRRFHH